jgi:hypothetical protein
MKTWMKVLLGIVGVVVVAVAAAIYFTAGMVDTADGFFAAVKQKDIAKARGYLAEEFKTNTDERALSEFLSKSAIMNFKESSWSSREVSGGRGELVGSITTDSGGAVPLKVSFVKENGAWKIYSLQKPVAGVQTESSSPSAPAKADGVALVKQSIHDFVVSVDKKNMEHFRGTVSQLWRKQITTEKLNEAFKPIMDSGANWAVLDSFEPVLSSDGKVDDNGVLLLAGHYPTKPRQVYFEQKFIYEGVAWKLVGFKIQAK